MTNSLWSRYQQWLCSVESVGVTLDISRMGFSDAWMADMLPAMQRAFEAMTALEQGAMANPDEQRKVGHYWLRAPQLAPPPEAQLIADALTTVKTFSAAVLTGQLKPPGAQRFTQQLIIGIGGSALGPQLAADALGTRAHALTPYFLDNTDPAGFDRLWAELGASLSETLVIVISKSGGTKETRNGMLETQAAFARAGLSFEKQAVAVTSVGSELHRTAEKWLARLPMWDWVGGRTSQTSAVGLLPAALQGLDIDALLAGAAEMDRATRSIDVKQNPAALLALMWHHGSQGRGAKDMVVLPYKDSLLLLSRYLQQLVMESLGKELDLSGRVVHQGLSVYGNKGSTDQHAYVQQLRDGVANHFVLFVEVLKDRPGKALEVDAGITSGDYLLGFLLGTRAALTEKHRESITLTLPDVTERSLGAVIALFERAVGLYASLIHVNAYHQPGVEAGKKAAEAVLQVQRALFTVLTPSPQDVETLSAAAKVQDVETAFQVLRHLAHNHRIRSEGAMHPRGARFSLNP